MCCLSRFSVTGLLVAGLLTAPIRGQQAPVPASSLSVVDLLDRYERGESMTALSRLPPDAVQALVRDLRRQGERWTKAAGGAVAPRRRVAVAAFVLELIDLHLRTIAGATLELLDWSSGLMRDGPPTQAEHAYFRASLVMLQALAARWGIVRVADAVAAPGLYNTHLLRATRRFPKDAEFALMDVIAADVQATWPGARDDLSLDPVSPKLFGAKLTALETRFYKIRDEPATRSELEIRWGVIELRGGKIRSALDHFDHAGTPAEPALRYWLHLFRGQAYERDGKPAEAMASYRLALDEVPQAQSAVMALSALLVEQHQPQRASELVDVALSLASPPLDPWVYYQYPQFRLWPGVMADLRRAVRQ